MSAILDVRDLTVRFPVRGRGLLARRRDLVAVDAVSFDMRAGETLGIVGESGCGKSTLGRAVLGLIAAQEGRIAWMGRDLRTLDAAQMRPLRRDLQIVFQDPLASLDPRMTVGDIVAEPLGNFEPGLPKEAAQARVRDMLAKVGLSPEMINRYPHEFSGGQCQRIGIARAMILKPKLIVCDEPVSALDVSIQAQIINLLAQLQREFGLALIFISHNLAVVRHISHRILVLYLGRIVEIAPRDELFARPRHPYTQALLASALTPDPRRARAKPRVAAIGDPPSPLDKPSGCAFRTRCPKASALCARETPALSDDGANAAWRVACHHWQDDSMSSRP
jgi:oligopeptide transport system ATP-binding protein